MAAVQRGDGDAEIGRVGGSCWNFQGIAAGLQFDQLVAEEFLCVNGDQGIRVGAGGLHPQLEWQAGNEVGGVGQQAQFRIIVATCGAKGGLCRNVMALLVLTG